MDTDAGLEDAARAYLAVAEGDADRALRLALADAREALAEASARISFFVRGRLPVGPAVAVAELEVRGSVAAPSRTMTRPVVL